MLVIELKRRGGGGDNLSCWNNYFLLESLSYNVTSYPGFLVTKLALTYVHTYLLTDLLTYLFAYLVCLLTYLLAYNILTKY